MNKNISHLLLVFVCFSCLPLLSAAPLAYSIDSNGNLTGIPESDAPGTSIMGYQMDDMKKLGEFAHKTLDSVDGSLGKILLDSKSHSLRLLDAAGNEILNVPLIHDIAFNSDDSISFDVKVPEWKRDIDETIEFRYRGYKINNAVKGKIIDSGTKVRIEIERGSVTLEDGREFKDVADAVFEVGESGELTYVKFRHDAFAKTKSQRYTIPVGEQEYAFSLGFGGSVEYDASKKQLILKEFKNLQNDEITIPESTETQILFNEDNSIKEVYLKDGTLDVTEKGVFSSTKGELTVHFDSEKPSAKELVGNVVFLGDDGDVYVSGLVTAKVGDGKYVYSGNGENSFFAYKANEKTFEVLGDFQLTYDETYEWNSKDGEIGFRKLKESLDTTETFDIVVLDSDSTKHTIHVENNEMTFENTKTIDLAEVGLGKAFNTLNDIHIAAHPEVQMQQFRDRLTELQEKIDATTDPVEFAQLTLQQKITEIGLGSLEKKMGLSISEGKPLSEGIVDLKNYQEALKEEISASTSPAERVRLGSILEQSITQHAQLLQSQEASIRNVVDVTFGQSTGTLSFDRSSVRLYTEGLNTIVGFQDEKGNFVSFDKWDPKDSTVLLDARTKAILRQVQRNPELTSLPDLRYTRYRNIGMGSVPERGPYSITLDRTTYQSSQQLMGSASELSGYFDSLAQSAQTTSERQYWHDLSGKMTLSHIQSQSQLPESLISSKNTAQTMQRYQDLINSNPSSMIKARAVAGQIQTLMRDNPLQNSEKIFSLQKDMMTHAKVAGDAQRKVLAGITTDSSVEEIKQAQQEALQFAQDITPVYVTNRQLDQTFLELGDKGINDIYNELYYELEDITGDGGLGGIYSHSFDSVSSALETTFTLFTEDIIQYGHFLYDEDAYREAFREKEKQILLVQFAQASLSKISESGVSVYEYTQMDAGEKFLTIYKALGHDKYLSAADLQRTLSTSERNGKFNYNLFKENLEKLGVNVNSEQFKDAMKKTGDTYGAIEHAKKLIQEKSGSEEENFLTLSTEAIKDKTIVDTDFLDILPDALQLTGNFLDEIASPGALAINLATFGTGQLAATSTRALAIATAEGLTGLAFQESLELAINGFENEAVRDFVSHALIIGGVAISAKAGFGFIEGIADKKLLSQMYKQGDSLVFAGSQDDLIEQMGRFGAEVTIEDGVAKVTKDGFEQTIKLSDDVVTGSRSLLEEQAEMSIKRQDLINHIIDGTPLTKPGSSIPGCFLPGTLIITPHGELRFIEDFSVGDPVLAYDLVNEKVVETSVSTTFKRLEESYYVIEYEILE